LARAASILAQAAPDGTDNEGGFAMIPRFLAVGILLLTQSALGADISPAVCKPGSTVSYFPDGRLQSCLLDDDLLVDGVNCAQYTQLTLFNTGRLRSCVTKDYYRYDPVICNAYSMVSFYPQGKLEVCTLFGTTVIDDRTCIEYQSITFYENGSLKSCSSPP
jgi:hypothetical protein